jgi:hypothetical protein
MSFHAKGYLLTSADGPQLWFLDTRMNIKAGGAPLTVVNSRPTPTRCPVRSVRSCPGRPASTPSPRGGVHGRTRASTGIPGPPTMRPTRL